MSKDTLETLYTQYNRKDLIQYDPIKYLYRFEDPKEIELVGLIASALSFGRVTQIFKAMERILQIVDGRPFDYVNTLGQRPEKAMLEFRYRFVTGKDVFRMFACAADIIREHGSIGEFAQKTYQKGQLMAFVDEFIHAFQGVYYLIPCSANNSPCKRLFMFLRWMVRQDNIDPGLWKFICPADLIMPLDTHIFRVSRELGLTTRKSASLSAAVEITDHLRRFSHEDPVRYDWALSHMGIIRNNFSSAPLEGT